MGRKPILLRYLTGFFCFVFLYSAFKNRYSVKAALQKSKAEQTRGDSTRIYHFGCKEESQTLKRNPSLVQFWYQINDEFQYNST